jgi:hypothetical protein
MTHTTYNLLEAIVRALIEVADSALEGEAASDLRQRLGQQLTQAKVAMQRDQAEDIVQDMAGAVVALSKFVLGRKPIVDDPNNVQRKHLQAALRDLEKRHEVRREVENAALHPTGRCICAGEGLCQWCQTHCVHCGANAEQHGPGSSHYFEPHGEGHEPDPEIADEKAENEARAKTIGFTEEKAEMIRGELSEPEYELQPGGELREKETEVEDKTLEDIGLDRDRWRLITDASGYPAVALYFNGGKDSLSQEQVEELEQALAPIIMAWGR